VRSHRSSVVRAARPQRRKLVWATDQLTTQTLASGARLNRDLLANLETAGSSVLGATVMRTHTVMSVTWNTADASQGVVYGYIVDTAPTVTNLDPSTSFGDDWMLLSNLTPGTSMNTVIEGTNVNAGRIIDLRAKRKIEELAEKYFIAVTNIGSSTISVALFTRTLIALP
jgi:hypothetical protein